MIERILHTTKITNYDFRRYACADDPLQERFEEWVPYYRMKWAIAHVLRPKSILETGVRYGYSARAFLDASPSAHYVGLDIDRPECGSVPGAVDWAEKSLNQFNAVIYKTDTQQLTRFPGEFYDLIHVDGQQDGDGTFHDLDLAVCQGRYILLDGLFWSRMNFQAANEWILLNKAAVEWSLSIPGYAGELLIKSKYDRSPCYAGKSESAKIVESYSSDYYLQDCGGFQDWIRNKGKFLTQPRQRAQIDVALHMIPDTRNILDLGCGRGELAYHIAKMGINVKAIHYAKNAISLAENTFDEDPDARSRVEFICGSVLDEDIYVKNYDLAIASDLIEHLSPREVAQLYKHVSTALRSHDGLFVIHTEPNLWNLQYEQPRSQKAAQRMVPGLFFFPPWQSAGKQQERGQSRLIRFDYAGYQV